MKAQSIVLFIAFVCLAHAYTAPSTLSKFHQTLKRAKLQAPNSNTAATSSSLMNGYASWYFHLQGGSFIQFQINGSGRRSELREMTLSGSNAAWSVSGSRSMVANIALPAMANGLNEVTFLQIHCGAGPALRVSWRKSYSQGGTTYNDAIISNVRTGLGNNQVSKKFLVSRHAGTKQYKIEVNNKNLKITIQGSGTVLNTNLNFWASYGNSCYFKAGAYNNNPSSSTATARTKFREIWW